MAIGPDRLAELEDERRFLIRSLADLEREHAAGDVDEVDYAALKDGYTVRAAATLRAIDEGRAALPPKPPADWRRRIAGALAIAATIGLVWWALVTSSAERPSGQSPVAVGDETQQLLSEARVAGSSDEAAALYARVLAIDPNNVEALAYRGWMLAIGTAQAAGSDPSVDVVARMREAIDSLYRATQLDPTYPDPACFLGIINFNFLGQAADAKPWVDRCLASNPPAEVRGLVEGLADKVAAAMATSGSTVPGE
jgi:tetratricopeptide (TPR) repeat protein